MLKLADILNYLKERTREQKMLWSGGYYMTADHTAKLSERISAQPNGVVIVWSNYDGAAKNFDWHCFFIPKFLVKLHGGTGHTFNMAGGSCSRVALKYVYIYDDKITGHANNNKAGTGSDITYDNRKYVLRYVIGV